MPLITIKDGFCTLSFFLTIVHGYEEENAEGQETRDQESGTRGLDAL